MGYDPSTGPTGLTLGALNAPGAWDGGYNAMYGSPKPPVPAQSPAQPQPAPSAGPPADPHQQSAPAPSPAAPAASGYVPRYNITDDLPQYVKNNWAALNASGKAAWDVAHPAPTTANQATQDWNQKQQTFTQNNQLYGITGYQGNANQVASQVAGGAQSAGIPMGVLGSSFYQGGADFGGQQNAGNSLNGNNGAVNWNDPSVANYGVSNAGYIPAVANALNSAKTALGTTALGATPVTTGQVGSFVSSIPGAFQNWQPPVQQQQAQLQPAQQAASYASSPAGPVQNARQYQAKGDVASGMNDTRSWTGSTFGTTPQQNMQAMYGGGYQGWLRKAGAGT